MCNQAASFTISLALAAKLGFIGGALLAQQ
jgi:hypothetical protein